MKCPKHKVKLVHWQHPLGPFRCPICATEPRRLPALFARAVREGKVSSRIDRIEAWAKFALKSGGPEDKFDVVLALVNVAKAAETRVAAEHNDTCGKVLSESEDYACSCGHDALREALAALGKAGGK
jgi:hypothetical protein